MSRYGVLRLARTAPFARTQPAIVRSPFTNASRSVSSSIGRRNKDDPYHKNSTAATGTSAGPHEGSASRTDNQISFEYPEDEEFPREKPVQGRGGEFHNSKMVI